MKKRVGSVLITVSAILLSSSIAFAATQDATVTETVEGVVEKTEEKVEEGTEKVVEKVEEATEKAVESTENTAELMSTEEVAKVKAETEAIAEAEAAKVEAEKVAAAKIEAEASKMEAVAKDEVATEKANTTKAEAEKDGNTGNAALAAGGVVTSNSGLPVGMTISTGASTSLGIFLPGFRRQYGVSPFISFSPTFTVPKWVDWQPNMILSGSLSVSISNIFKTYGAAGGAFSTTTSPSRNIPRISDFLVSLVLPALLNESTFTGVTFTPVLTVGLPLSMFARHQNRIASLGASIQGSWNTATKKLIDPKYGVIGLQYRGGVSGPLFHTNSTTYDCAQAGEERSILGIPFGEFEENSEIIGAPREEERLGNGRCQAAGRQVALFVSNSLRTFYNINDPFGGSHTFVIGGGLTNIFSRPLTTKSDLKSSPYAVRDTFLSAREWTSTSLTYVYGLPIDTQVQLMGGLSSGQPLHDNLGNLRFPFFDFSLGNGFTAASFSAVVSF